MVGAGGDAVHLLLIIRDSSLNANFFITAARSASDMLIAWKKLVKHINVVNDFMHFENILFSIQTFTNNVKVYSWNISLKIFCLSLKVCTNLSQFSSGSAGS